MKGNADTHAYTKKGKEKHDKVKWNQYCKGCNKVLCACKIKKEKK